MRVGNGEKEDSTVPLGPGIGIKCILYQSVEVHGNEFQGAFFTIHLVNLPNHWAVLIHRTSDHETWSLNSGKSAIFWCSRVHTKFKRRIGIDDIPSTYLVNLQKPQTDNWSCGLHAIAKITADYGLQV